MAKSRKYQFDIKKLCTPSMLYFVISLMALIGLGIQNVQSDDNTLCVGAYQCSIGSKISVFILNGIYILFWTFLLDMMCKNGYSDLSWLIVLIPILLFFLFLGLILYNSPMMV